MFFRTEVYNNVDWCCLSNKLFYLFHCFQQILPVQNKEVGERKMHEIYPVYTAVNFCHLKQYILGLIHTRDNNNCDNIWKMKIRFQKLYMVISPFLLFYDDVISNISFFLTGGPQ